jgi:hypothetical protein
MRSSSRLARLEKLAGKDSCPSCRLHRRDRWIDHARPTDPGPHAAGVCDLCGAATRVSLGPYDEGARTMLRVAYGGAPEHLFTDQRVRAARLWLALRPDRPSPRKRRGRGAEPAGPDTSSGAPSPAARPRRPSLAAKLRRKLIEEEGAALDRLFKDLRARHGEDPFPDITAQLEDAQGPDFEALYRGEPFAPDVDARRLREIKEEADAAAKCAEAELIVLGAVRDQTREALAECKRRASALVGEARRRHEERGAERDRKKHAPSRGRLSEGRAESPAGHPAAPAGPQAPGNPIAEGEDPAAVREDGDSTRALADIFCRDLP